MALAVSAGNFDHAVLSQCWYVKLEAIATCSRIAVPYMHTHYLQRTTLYTLPMQPHHAHSTLARYAFMRLALKGTITVGMPLRSSVARAGHLVIMCS